MRKVPQSIDEVNRVTETLDRQGVFKALIDFKARDHVQLRVRGETLCGVVRGHYERWISGSGVRVTVKTAIGDYRVRPFDLRKCSSVGDGRCACVDGARSAPAARALASGVPPLGNTGVAA